MIYSLEGTVFACIVKINKDPGKTAGLFEEVSITVGEGCENGPVHNIHIQIEITNEPACRGSIIWVEDDQSQGGTESLEPNTEIIANQTCPENHKLDFHAGKIQIPVMVSRVSLRPAAAKAIHQSHCDTVDSAVVGMCSLDIQVDLN